MAKSISVAVAESETMWVGFWASVTPPTVTGNAALGAGGAWSAGLLQAVRVRASAAATATMELEMRLIRSSCRSRDLASPTGAGASVCEALFLESAVRDQPTGDLACPPKGYHSCGTAPESHRLRCGSVTAEGTPSPGPRLHRARQRRSPRGQDRRSGCGMR